MLRLQILRGERQKTDPYQSEKNKKLYIKKKNINEKMNRNVYQRD